MESVFATLNEAFPSGGDAFETLKQTADLSPRVVNHLKNVYGFLAVLLASATVGAYLAVTRVFALAGAWHFLGSLAVMFGFGWAKTEDQKKALGMLLAFMQGNGLGPVLSMAGFVGGDRLIFLALGATAMIFIGFTGATLLSGRDASASRWKLYTLGTLGSMAMVYPYLLLFNLFFGFGTTYAIELYLGLGGCNENLIFCPHF